MNYLNDPVQLLSNIMGHAIHVGASDIHYKDRDWAHYRETKEDKQVNKTRRPEMCELEVIAMFPQTWGSTALGFSGIGGAAMTSAYTVVLQEPSGEHLVYFGGRFAYKAPARNEVFGEDLIKRQLKSVAQSGIYLNKGVCHAE